MNLHSIVRPEVIVAALLALAPMLGVAFFSARIPSIQQKLPRAVLLLIPSLLCVPYALVAQSFGMLRWNWLVLYALLPVAIAVALSQARNADPEQKGDWRDFLILLVLGIVVDLRWMEPAWPTGLTALGKMLLLDAGIYGFLAVRQLDRVGFDLRLRLRDLGIGLREFCFYAPIAIALGLSLRFLHFHAAWPPLISALGAYLFTLLFIAIPEELFFRGWLQNLLERRLGRTAALLITALLFGLAHWNKRTTSFNWQYVLLAALAGIFYGRAWRTDRRVGASAVSHATVDTLWSLWFR
ncbi:MAG TPA: CPBP family intramembrane glutamic endopeptidase [Terracidiphilus sp.]|jgi:hypothetical protein|nr:CPBP family intramembrane glutamic endopeptidase [Terracidiphilus sp.]